jgi:hypothetical protein
VRESIFYTHIVSERYSCALLCSPHVKMTYLYHFVRKLHLP